MKARRELGDLLGRLAPEVLGVLTRRWGDFAAAEDAVQEALVAAAAHWPGEGVPDNPVGWLIRTAERRLTDHHRGETSRRRREETVFRREPTPAEPTGSPDQDDTLPLLFLCCHPTITPASAVALTLRAVGGLTTAEIAAAFLVPEATMAQRISRAKARIAAAGGRFPMPSEDERAERVPSVLSVLYLMFNEGYTSSTGDELHRVDLSAEAIRLTRAVHARSAEDPEITGLLALMLLTDARRPARTGPNGELVPLADQDRTRWNRAMIVEGLSLVVAARAYGVVGEYQLQASIAAVHDAAPTAADTDWSQVVSLYGLLERLNDNPMAALNQAVAVAMTDGPAAGLARVDAVAPRLPGHHRVAAVRGHLTEMLGDFDAAAAQYATAAARTTNLTEQRYLILRAARLASS